jgi:ribulose-bisphosphate carboxylase large chain
MKKKRNTDISMSCDRHTPSQCKCGENKDHFYRYKGNSKWGGVKVQKYKLSDGGWSAITKQVLVGNQAETTRFHLRYFEIAPGGFSSHEWHRHEHVVICIRGKGTVVLGKKTHKMNYLDTLYIAPQTPHQLQNPFSEPFGFLCIVNAKRDRPKAVNLRLKSPRRQ